MSFSSRQPSTRTSTGCRFSIPINLTEPPARRLSIIGMPSINAQAPPAMAEVRRISQSRKGANMKLIAFTILIAALPAAAQRQQKSLSCENRTFNYDRMVTHCEMREQTLASAGSLAVDAGINGGVTVRGWDNNSVLVRSKVEGAGLDDSSAAA